MSNCSFCGKPVEAGTGKMYIKRDATVFHFCSSKCQRNQVELGRVNRHVGWTKAYAEHKGDRQTTSARAAGKGTATGKAVAAAKPAKPAKPAKAAKKTAEAQAE
ncbi:MAG: large subunit ribosomal protein L24e [Thermoplasmata archaeon]|nr:large subunit ribosomal protein L24e [Thermoplasmata archaeon]